MQTIEEKRAYFAQKAREHRARHANDPEYRAKRQKWNKTYSDGNKEKISEKNKAAYALNPEPIKQRAAKYYHENADKVAAYKEANRDKRNAQTKAWHEANRDRDKEYSKLYYEENSEKIKSNSKQYYDKNSEVQKLKSAQWRKENPDKFKEQQESYRKNNVTKLLDKNAKRRALKRGATIEAVDRNEVYLRAGGICGICNKHVPLDKMTIDHVIPLIKGGAHSMQNVQIAHLSCNSAKGSKILN